MSIFDVSGTVVAITGASRGIGFAVARQFVACGAKVVIGGLDPGEVGEAVKRLQAKTRVGDVIGVPGDISQPAAGRVLIDAALQEFGRLDTLVCNAGIDVVKPAINYQQEDWDRVLSVNLRGAFLPAQAAASMWIDRGQQAASIIFTSSITARAGAVGLAPYSASKGGVEQLVRSLAVEWAEHGIRVNAVAPGYVDNIMAGVEIHADPSNEERIRTFTPMRRRGSVDEIAASFVFLASPAAAYITGAVLAVDGGFTAQ